MHGGKLETYSLSMSITFVVPLDYLVHCSVYNKCIYLLPHLKHFVIANIVMGNLQ